MPKLAPSVTLTKVEGREVLFSLRSGDTYGLNETAALFVRELVAGSFDSAVAAVAREYEVAPTEVEADMRALFDELVGSKLLTP